MSSRSAFDTPPFRRENRLPRRRRLISLTPLIDVVFILLVFFMLASSFLDWKAIDLETPGQGSVSTPAGDAVLIEVYADGTLRMGGEILSQDEVSTRVRAEVSASGDQRVLVRAESGVPLQRTVALIDQLTAAGVRNVALLRSGER